MTDTRAIELLERAYGLVRCGACPDKGQDVCANPREVREGIAAYLREMAQYPDHHTFSGSTAELVRHNERVRLAAAARVALERLGLNEKPMDWDEAERVLRDVCYQHVAAQYEPPGALRVAALAHRFRTQLERTRELYDSIMALKR